MMKHPCIAGEKRPANVILFGLVVPVQYKPPRNLGLYCIACDEYGREYDIYTDYDPCLQVSHTVAVVKHDGQ